jgi:hypothetical protein
MAQRYNASSGVRKRVFMVGEFVRRRKKRLSSQIIPKFAPRWEGPFVIHSVGPHDSYVLAKPNGDLEPHPVNGNHLESFIRGVSRNLAHISVSTHCIRLHFKRMLPSGLSVVFWSVRALGGGNTVKR